MNHAKYMIGLLPLLVLSLACGPKEWKVVETLYSDKNIEVNGVAFTPERTVLHMTAQGRPGSRFTVQQNAYLLGDKGQRYALTGGEGITPGPDYREKYGPDGKASFDLYFAPAPTGTRALDFIEPGGWMVYGIHDSLRPLKIKPVQDASAAVRDENAFFRKGTGTLCGRFEGSRRPELLEFFGYNAFQEGNKQSCPVGEDGSFRMEISLEHPILSYVWDDHHTSYYFFLEPDGQAQMTVDSTGAVHFPAGTRCGALAEWMSGAMPYIHYPLWKSISQEEWKTLSFSEINARTVAHYAQMEQLVDYICRRQGFSAEEAHLLKQYLRINGAMDEMSVKIYMPRPAPGVPADSLTLQRNQDMADPAQYILTPRLDPTDWTAFALNNDIFFLSNRYQYSPLLSNKTPIEMATVDSALFRQAGPSIFLQAALQNRKTLEQEAERPVANWVRLLADGSFETETVDARKVWDERLSVMSSPYLKARMQATLDELCAEKAKTYTLPDGQATDIFNNLVAPFRGKWVYIDFWSTGCGPCRAGIEASKALRKKIASSPDLELVFITGDRSTPAAAYEKYVAEHLAGEVSYRIPEAQYIQLTTLFGFNGIPHNELVTPDGQIVNGSLPRLGDDGFLEALEKLK